MAMQGFPGQNLVNRGGSVARVFANAGAKRAAGGANPYGSRVVARPAPTQNVVLRPNPGNAQGSAGGRVPGTGGITAGKAPTAATGNTSNTGGRPGAGHVVLRPGGTPVVDNGNQTGISGSGSGQTGTGMHDGNPNYVPPKPTMPPNVGYMWTLVNNHWVQKLIGGIDPRDSIYQMQYAGGANAHDNDIAEQRRILSQLPAQFNLADASRQRNYMRDTYDTNASLAARGIFRSGSNDQALVNRTISDYANRQQINNQYGTGRQAEIARAMQQIEDAWRMQQTSYMTDAMNRYQQNNPASMYLAGGAQ